MISENTEEYLPMVSIITVFYNRAGLVRSSVGSLLQQTYANLEIIVVDDGSTDATLAELKQLDDPRLRVLTKSNSGFTNSMIWAIAQAKGSIIAVHGAGDISYANRIQRQVDALLADEKVGVVGSLVLNPIIGTDKTKIVGAKNGLNFRQTLLRDNIFTHGEVAFRKSAYDQAGGYRSFFRFSQDLDLWLRMSAHCDYHTVQEILYERFEIAGSVSASPDKAAIQQRYSELGRQSAESIDRGGQDLYDQFGDQALLRMRKSRRLSSKLTRLAQRRVARSRDFHGAAMLAKHALTERSSPINIGSFLLCKGLSLVSPPGR
ncbi:glycosyltransferase family 2 protein [Sphingomonas sp. 37zxx]|uniref:glycosyltransferase family 2 protein n=1 Tax=Sphingomonas sp. 37zxx TaxID=1550073 RepID=UPI0006910C85|nr:glycosyltransferase [Sphingomonas sp. 37zxx]